MCWCEILVWLIVFEMSDIWYLVLMFWIGLDWRWIVVLNVYVSWILEEVVSISILNKFILVVCLWIL